MTISSLKSTVRSDLKLTSLYGRGGGVVLGWGQGSIPFLSQTVPDSFWGMAAFCWTVLGH